MTAYYYRDLLAKHGPTYQAVDAGSLESQRTRLAVLTSIIPTHATILDIGCGYGALLEQSWIKSERYLGIDYLPEMIEAAKKKYPGYRFEVGDIMQPKPAWAADYVMANGLFQFADDFFVLKTVPTLFALARKGVAINFLRKGRSDEYTVSPKGMLSYMDYLTPWYAIKADYLPNDFTLYLYKQRS